MSFLERLHWRYATKTFDSSRPLKAGDLDRILEATRLAPTSYGLQPFHVHVIRDEETKQRLSASGWKQPQWTTAPVTLIFTTRTDVEARIEGYFDMAAGGVAEKREAMRGYEKVMRNWSATLTHEQAQQWAAKQAYIALGFAMAACAELEIDSCPMEGFRVEDFDSILQLPPGRKTAVALCIGYRDPAAKLRDKLRFEPGDIFTEGVFKK